LPRRVPLINEAGGHIAELMLEADVMVGSGGMSVYEIAALGTPGVILGQNAREDKRMRDFARHGTAEYLGLGTEVEEAALAEAVIARGDTVYLLDNLSTGSIENIEHLKGDRRFHYAIDSVMNEPITAELIDRVDVVYHLAAAVGVRLIVESPVNTIETNVHGTEMVLKLANKKKKKLLVASTSEVYGKSEDVPFRDDADIVMGPTSQGRWTHACSQAI